MPDLGEWLLLSLIGGTVLLAVAWPFLGERAPHEGAADEGEPTDREAQAVRHRVALETLRDVEADHRAGLLDEASYAEQRAEAEARAAATLTEVEEPGAAGTPRQDRSGRRAGLLIGVALGALLLVGFALPRPLGVGEATATNQALAAAIAREETRQAQIGALRERLSSDPRNAQALSDLADAYLDGGSAQDLRNAGVALLALLVLDPENESAYRRLITAYITAGDWTDARSATEAYADIVGEDEPDIPFFRGLIALRADGDEEEAARQFDRFLALAPDDPRAAMIRSLRAEAAGELPGS